MEAPLKGVYVRKKGQKRSKICPNPAEFFTNGAFFRKNRLFSHKISLIWVGFIPSDPLGYWGLFWMTTGAAFILKKAKKCQKWAKIRPKSAKIWHIGAQKKIRFQKQNTLKIFFSRPEPISVPKRRGPHEPLTEFGVGSDSFV